MDSFEDYRIIIYVVLVVILLVVVFLLFTPLLKRLNGRSYKELSRVTEDDFVKNEPQIVKKTGKEEKLNDN